MTQQDLGLSLLPEAKFETNVEAITPSDRQEYLLLGMKSILDARAESAQLMAIPEVPGSYGCSVSFDDLRQVMPDGQEGHFYILRKTGNWERQTWVKIDGRIAWDDQSGQLIVDAEGNVQPPFDTHMGSHVLIDVPTGGTEIQIVPLQGDTPEGTKTRIGLTCGSVEQLVRHMKANEDLRARGIKSRLVVMVLLPAGSWVEAQVTKLTADVLTVKTTKEINIVPGMNDEAIAKYVRIDFDLDLAPDEPAATSLLTEADRAAVDPHVVRPAADGRGFLIGCSSENLLVSMVVMDDTIEETHAFINRDEHGWYLRNVQAGHMTFVNEQQLTGLQEVILQEGAVIRLGEHTRMLVHITGEGEAQHIELRMLSFRSLEAARASMPTRQDLTTVMPSNKGSIAEGALAYIDHEGDLVLARAVGAGVDRKWQLIGTETGKAANAPVRLGEENIYLISEFAVPVHEQIDVRDRREAEVIRALREHCRCSQEMAMALFHTHVMAAGEQQFRFGLDQITTLNFRGRVLADNDQTMLRAMTGLRSLDLPQLAHAELYIAVFQEMVQANGWIVIYAPSFDRGVLFLQTDHLRRVLNLDGTAEHTQFFGKIAGLDNTDDTIIHQEQAEGTTADSLGLAAGRVQGQRTDKQEDEIFASTDLERLALLLEMAPAEAETLISQRGTLHLVADGHGNEGDSAARLAIASVVREYYLNPAFDSAKAGELLQYAMLRAHQTVWSAGLGGRHDGSSYATITGVVTLGNIIFGSNLGNVNAYAIDQNESTLVSDCQTAGMKDWKANIPGVTEADAMRQCNKMIGHAAGCSAPGDARSIQELEQGGVPTWEFQDQRYILLCPDGLWGAVTEAEVRAILNDDGEYKTLAAKRDALILAAQKSERGRGDDISVLLLDREKKDPPTAWNVDRVPAKRDPVDAPPPADTGTETLFAEAVESLSTAFRKTGASDDWISADDPAVLSLLNRIDGRSMSYEHFFGSTVELADHPPITIEVRVLGSHQVEYRLSRTVEGSEQVAVVRATLPLHGTNDQIRVRETVIDSFAGRMSMVERTGTRAVRELTVNGILRRADPTFSLRDGEQMLLTDRPTRALVNLNLAVWDIRHLHWFTRYLRNPAKYAAHSVVSGDSWPHRGVVGRFDRMESTMKLAVDALREAMNQMDLPDGMQEHISDNFFQYTDYLEASPDRSERIGGIAEGAEVIEDLISRVPAEQMDGQWKALPSDPSDLEARLLSLMEGPHADMLVSRVRYSPPDGRRVEFRLEPGLSHGDNICSGYAELDADRQVTRITVFEPQDRSGSLINGNLDTLATIYGLNGEILYQFRIPLDRTQATEIIVPDNGWSRLSRRIGRLPLVGHGAQKQFHRVLKAADQDLELAMQQAVLARQRLVAADRQPVGGEECVRVFSEYDEHSAATLDQTQVSEVLRSLHKMRSVIIVFPADAQYRIDDIDAALKEPAAVLLDTPIRGKIKSVSGSTERVITVRDVLMAAKKGNLWAVEEREVLQQLPRNIGSDVMINLDRGWEGELGRSLAVDHLVPVDRLDQEMDLHGDPGRVIFVDRRTGEVFLPAVGQDGRIDLRGNFVTCVGTVGGSENRREQKELVALVLNEQVARARLTDGVCDSSGDEGLVSVANNALPVGCELSRSYTVSIPRGSVNSHDLCRYEHVHDDIRSRSETRRTHPRSRLFYHDGNAWQALPGDLNLGQVIGRLNPQPDPLLLGVAEYLYPEDRRTSETPTPSRSDIGPRSRGRTRFDPGAWLRSLSERLLGAEPPDEGSKASAAVPLREAAPEAAAESKGKQLFPELWDQFAEYEHEGWEWSAVQFDEAGVSTLKRGDMLILHLKDGPRACPITQTSSRVAGQDAVDRYGVGFPDAKGGMGWVTCEERKAKWFRDGKIPVLRKSSKKRK